MKYLIYGSTAIKHFFPDYNQEPKDLDIITETDNKISIENVKKIFAEKSKTNLKIKRNTYIELY